jgi:hypothetical protein
MPPAPASSTGLTKLDQGGHSPNGIGTTSDPTVVAVS